MNEAQLVSLPALAGSPQATLIKGILVQFNSSSGRNPAAAFPLSELAPYQQRDYVWNPAGMDMEAASFPFAITQLDENATSHAQHWADQNHEQVCKAALNALIQLVYMLLPVLVSRQQ